MMFRHVEVAVKEEKIAPRAIIVGEPRCMVCGEVMICPACVGRLGGKKAARMYTVEQRKEWGKLGGRPVEGNETPQ